MKCPFLYHKPPPKLFLWIPSASQPWTTCNYTSPDPPHQHLHLQDHLGKAAWTTAATISLYNQRISCLRGAHVHARHRSRSLDPNAVLYRNWLGQMVPFDGIWNFGEVFSSRMTWLYSADSIGEWFHPFIRDHHLILPHDCAQPHFRTSTRNFWTWKTSRFLHVQQTHRTRFPLSMCGMLWINVYKREFQFLTLLSNFAQLF